MKRGIDNVAYDIIEDWSENHTKDIPDVVKPFLNAMTQLVSKDDLYGYDSADMIVNLFIMNAQRIYKTEKSKTYIKELKELIK